MLNRWMRSVAAVALALAVVLGFGLAEAAGSDNADFVLLSEVVPDAILEIRYYSTYNFVGDRIDGYEEPVALLSRKAAEALKAVSDELLEQGYRLKIFDAYRPQSAVDHFVRWAKDPEDTRMASCFYPEIRKSLLFSQGYIAAKSGHSRGSTIDLTLFDIAAGREVDMGGTFDYFGERSHPDYRGITEEQRANRMILRNAMLAHGFKGISMEWWHYTLVDEPYKNMYFNFPVSSDSIHGPAAGEADVEPATVLSEGMKGDAVRELQELLVITGYLNDAADGSFGPKTGRAIMDLQAAHGMELTGEAGEMELHILQTEVETIMLEQAAEYLVETRLEGRLENPSDTPEFIYSGEWSREPDGSFMISDALMRFPGNGFYALMSCRASANGAELVTGIDALSILAEQ